MKVGSIIAVTGEVDFGTDGKFAVRIAGGSPLMPQVTATGCALNCLAGAYVAAEKNHFGGTVGARA